jgi:hypothetical protein
VIFPIDVHTRVKKGTATSSSGHVKFVLALLFIFNIGFLLLTSSFWESIGVPLLLVGFVQFAIFLFIAVTCFRFLIFREQDREREEESDTFAQYYGLRPVSEVVTVNKELSFDAFELQNSSFVFCLSFRFGVNDAVRASGTFEFWSKLANIIGSAHMTMRPIVVTDVYNDSKAADEYLSTCNRASGEKLRQTINEIATLTLDYTAQYSKVESVVIMVYAGNKFQMYEFDDVVKRILSAYEQTFHSFRSMEFLVHESLLKVFEQFYGVEVIDLTLSKLQLKPSDDSFASAIQVYRVGATNGRILTRAIFDGINTSARRIN